MRSELSVRRQAKAVARHMIHGPRWKDLAAYDVALMQGMQQALFWVLEENAASPKKCLPFPKRTRKGGKR